MKRYHLYIGEAEDGEWVKYEDAMAALHRLKELLSTQGNSLDRKARHEEIRAILGITSQEPQQTDICYEEE